MENKINVNGEVIEIKQNLIKTSRGIPILRNDILTWLKRIGISGEYVSINYGASMRDSWAEVSWEVNGKPYFYRCQSQNRPVDNLAAVEQLVHQEVLFIQRGIKTLGQMLNQFALPAPEDIKDSFDPRKVLGIPKNVTDKEYIKYKFREAAKKHHPDKGGDPEKFKDIQKAWEMLK